MVFSSMVFLWIFLPVVFIAYRMIEKKCGNIFLLLVSLFFYAWGEPKYIVLMLCSILLNYIAGMLLDYFDISERARKITILAAVILNLALLGYFKYFNFFADTLNHVVQRDVVGVREIALPIGISFYTFQAMSYIIDLYRRNIRAQKNILYLALYISFFPQLIAGPIVKYRDIDAQILNRVVTPEKTAEGIRRFIYGLAKKVLIANSVALCADNIFALGFEDLTGAMAWISVILYGVQIYYDFSGYSDMAIGLGHMFGFKFMENFNYPFLSKSIREFWNRWHISMSTWFKEYLYIPLGGNRKGSFRTYINLGLVFLATGLWHGASWNYVIWGLYHGFFIIIERMGFGDFIEKRCRGIFGHIYALLVITVGWTLFRLENMHASLVYLKRMVLPFRYTESAYSVMELLNREAILAAVLGILGCGFLNKLLKKIPWIQNKKYKGIELIYCMFLFVLCIVHLASNTYNPFIYFRF